MMQAVTAGGFLMPNGWALAAHHHRSARASYGGGLGALSPDTCHNNLSARRIERLLRHAGAHQPPWQSDER